MKFNPYLGLLLLTSFLFLTHCKQNKNQTVENKLDNGEVEFYQILPSDTTKKEGWYFRLNAQGDTLEKVEYVNGLMEGQRVLFYPNGQIHIVENYINNQYNGPYQSFYENGAPKQFGTFKDGQFEGDLKTYFEQPAGQLKEVIELKKGIESGAVKQYYSNGKLQSEGSYSEGYKDGPFKEYHENGSLAAEGAYINDFEDGQVKIFDTTGTLVKIYVFKDKKPIETIKVR
ncbi:MAG TPA: toxin-antitoxin system YwqK family antitoxin [Chitinophagales bacterium]|nr:toxin-antitoxin system YwqK family antitoxin [Chitinophagales bacterium]